MTPEQEFNYFKKFGKMPEKKPKASKTHGILYLKDSPLTQPLPYPILQKIKAEYIARGYSKTDIKIRKYYER